MSQRLKANAIQFLPAPVIPVQSYCGFESAGIARCRLLSVTCSTRW
jgi:hypothetical protein